MAGFTQQVAVSVLVANLLIVGGCSTTRTAMDGLINRGAAIQEVREKKIEIAVGLHEQRMAEKLAEIDDRLRMLNQLACTQTETTLSMEMSQSLEMQDITVDVEELKNVIARAEAQARAESLRRERLPGLLREQQEAFGGNGFGFNDQPPGFEQVAYDRNVRQAADEADMVVGIDQKGNPLPYCEDKRPSIGPSEIPYLVRMRINVGLQNPRLEKSKVRRNPGCGLPDCHGKGCSKCATLIRVDRRHYANVGTVQMADTQVAAIARAADGWPKERRGIQHRLPDADARPANDTRVAARPVTGNYPTTQAPERFRGGSEGAAYTPIYSPNLARPLTAAPGEPSWSRVRDNSDDNIR